VSCSPWIPQDVHGGWVEEGGNSAINATKCQGTMLRYSIVEDDHCRALVLHECSLDKWRVKAICQADGQSDWQHSMRNIFRESPVPALSAVNRTNAEVSRLALTNICIPDSSAPPLVLEWRCQSRTWREREIEVHLLSKAKKNYWDTNVCRRMKSHRRKK